MSLVMGLIHRTLVLFFCLLFCHSVAGRLTTTPQNVVVSRGEDAILNCSTDAASAADYNPITWDYDLDIVSFTPCQLQHPGFEVLPVGTTGCNIRALASWEHGISGPYKCSAGAGRALAMVIVVDRPVCEFARPVVEGGNAILICRTTYDWQAKAIQFNTPPQLSVSAVCTDVSGTTLRSTKTAADPGTFNGKIESNLTIENVTLQAALSHRCTIQFNFSKGNNPFIEYATNSLSSPPCDWFDSKNDSSVPIIFFPFGTTKGDGVVPFGDDASSPAVDIAAGFPFLFGTYSTVFVNSDGRISFGSAIHGEHTPSPLPVRSESTPFIAPYWADVDTSRNNGRIYYRPVTDFATLGRATRDVHAKFPYYHFFNATWAFIATWHNATFYGASVQPYPINMFQVVLVADDSMSFVMFNYGNLSWTTGVLSGGDPATGLGGNPAGVGFQRSTELYYEHPLSVTTGVVDINSRTNTRERGRWMYRVDGGDDNETCVLHSIKANTPAITDCPLLVGPTVINRTQIEFYCDVATNVTDPRARFNVSFLFNFEVDAGVPVQVLDITNLRATLHERYLAGRLNKALSCSVTSYFVDTPSDQSRQVYSGRHFTPRVWASLHELVISESDPGPARLILYSSLPITCQAVTDVPINCWIKFSIKASNGDIAVRQRLPLAYEGLNAESKAPDVCTYQLDEKDWKPAEGYAYDSSQSLDIVAKVDLPATVEPRLSQIEFAFEPELGDYKKINGEQYLNPWFNYRVPQPVLVYRHDALMPMVVCKSRGDPHMTTFDRLSYDIYSTGNFIYVRNLSYPAVEVQVKHWACTQWPAAVSCVCGVAMRENDTILIADRCAGESNITKMNYITYSDENLPDDAGITVSDSALTFKIQMSSGNKIIGRLQRQHIDIEIYISSKTPTEGLCGTFDGNRSNDIFHRLTRVPATFNGRLIDSSTAASWRVTDVKEDLFHGNMAPASPNPDPLNVRLRSFCLCNGSETCSRRAVSDTTAEGSEPQRNVRLGVPRFNIAKRRKRRASGPTDDVSTGSSRTYRTIYNAIFDERSDNQTIAKWPAPGNITELEATETCRAIIVNTTVIGPTCFRNLGYDNSSAIDIVDACIVDVQITGNYLWAEGQVATMQKACIDDILMFNYTDLNDTEALYDVTNNGVRDINDYKCEPFDCNNNGVCDKGSCSCNLGYIDVDCGLNMFDIPSVTGILDLGACCSIDCKGDACTQTEIDDCKRVGLSVDDATYDAKCRFQVDTGGTYIVTGKRDTRETMTCDLPQQALLVHVVNFTAMRPADSNFSSLPLGGARQIYTVSVSNNGHDFSGSSQIYTLSHKTCIRCTESGPARMSDTCIINGYCFEADDVNPYVDCLKCQPGQSTTSWTPDFPCPAPSEAKFYANGTCYCDVTEPCPEAFPEYWIEYVNTHLYSGVANSASDLASCQSYCSSHSSCTRVDWNPAASVGQQCWIHGSWSSSQSRRPASGINHYELKRMAVGHWVMYSDAYVSRGIAAGAAELGDCQASCISNVGCTRIDWSPTAADGQRCWLHGSWSGSEPRRSRQGFTHYELYRGNDGLCGCSPSWTIEDDRSAPGGVSSSANTVEDCRSECSLSSSCTAVDWNGGQSSGQRCHLHGPWSQGSPTYRSGTQHHTISRTCGCSATWTTLVDTSVDGGVSTGASTVADCLNDCYRNAGCTAVDWNPTSAVGSRCRLHGSWSSGTRNSRSGVQHFIITRSCEVTTSTERTTSVMTTPADCVTWTIQDDYGGFGDRSSVATTVDECRAECSSNGGCTAIDWVAWLSTGSQCWLVGFWTTWSGDRPGIQRHTMSNRCVATSTEHTMMSTPPDCVTTWTIQNDYGGFGDRSSTATTVEECRAQCSNNGECTAIDWVATLSTGSQCWLVGPWTTSSGARPGIGLQRHSITRTCGCVSWTIRNDYGGFDDRSSTATTVHDCRTQCSNNVECTAIDWVAALSTGSQCWLVGPWTTSSGYRAGIQRHTISRTFNDCKTWTIQDDYGGFDDRSSTATTVEECRTECSNNGECTAIDWVAALSTGSQCWLVGPWTTSSGGRAGIQRHSISRTCDGCH